MLKVLVSWSVALLFVMAHSECLQEICRLCGEVRTIVEGRHPIPKETVGRQIEAAFSVCVADDDAGVHPPFICKLCHLKLGRWWAKFSGKNMKGAKCNIQVATFDGSSCSKCVGSAPSVPARLEAYEREGRQHGLMTWYAADRLQIVKMNAVGLPVVYLTVFANLSWQLSIAGVQLNEDVFSLGIEPVLDVSGCADLCKLIAERKVCSGNDDFKELISLKKGPEGQIPTFITPQDVFVCDTIRHKRCKLLIDAEGDENQRCEVCRIHRSDLSGLAGRLKAKQGSIITASSTIPNKAMTHLQLQQKASLLQADRRSLKRKNLALQEKVASMIRDESILVDDQQETALKATLEKADEEMESVFRDGSPAKLMWEQQKASAIKGKQMRWHPAIIRWCIALHSKSTSGYNLLRESGFLRLPHPTTLHPYSHFTDLTPGFSPALLNRIVQDINLLSRPEEERNVCLLFDEMKVKSGLVYSTRSGQLVGFTDVGDIANEVKEFERLCSGNTEVPLASHVLVLMIRGLCSNLHSPVGYYPSEGVTSGQLYPCLSEAIIFIETAGFIVRALVSDGASANRKFYRLNEYQDDTTNSASPTYFTPHPLDPSRKIYFICDVPHLMKTTRNNWENSGYHNKTKNLTYNNQSISWLQLLQLYEWDIDLERTSPGLRRLHKINWEHLHLTPAHRMRVYMAVQVLSSTVANCFESLGRTDTSSTVKFIRFMDQFLDCLNVSNPQQAARTRKAALAPYTSTDDWRFEWLIKDFLGFLQEWEDQVKAIPGLDKKTRKSMCLSKETVEGLRITVYSFVDLARVLLASPGVKYVLSEKLNQDPLEEYFSKQRSAGGSWDNPTIGQFQFNALALHVASSSVKASKKGNSRNLERQDDSSSIDDTPLPRRK